MHIVWKLPLYTSAAITDTFLQFLLGQISLKYACKYNQSKLSTFQTQSNAIPNKHRLCSQLLLSIVSELVAQETKFIDNPFC